MTRRALPACLVAVLLVVTGCSGRFSGMADLPLPGGADVGPDPYRVTVLFTDVADLVPQAAVKVNDVPVGRVEGIALRADNRTAEVRVLLARSVVLPANATGRLRQSSLLGEKYVDLSPPAAEPPAGTLADGAVIGVDRTTRGTEVEEVLGAVSLVLSGGGLTQLRSIATELDAALSGNTEHIRSLLSNVETLAAALDARRGDIVRALDGVERLTGTLAAQRDTIAGALDGLGPGMRVLTEQRDQLVALLAAMDRLSDVTVDTLDRGRAELLADLRALVPILGRLADAGSALPESLELLLTFPFPDEGLDVIKGDYANARIKADLRLDELLRNLDSPYPIIQPPGGSPTPNPGGTVPAPGPPLPLPPVGPAPPAGPGPLDGPLGGLVDGLLGGLTGGA
ncbi:phospholipid/cholesterol/gamma-HCH transport system substrate-binding protein [Amycolatopsis arida]|uniref:Phospholipid/cholesterol/gamma-HCH transport system substrate-binding protein n=1 Tax=Amycolatopsis arida TaxID=587909 RepID=A0A1I5VC60_9PSEU|nr:MCE family protein [Amycolatopsis arida]TDX91225.1 phospholipid/cholesterol/gamma-HCH transport system substrate-binding protein [Amycolatopsis arida]SFQ05050.1 phospholipid/cholesterol/gamma-HCH transport system substrate-binding protein [Amycolatopsis arida]